MLPVLLPFLLGCQPRSSGPLTHQAYVWQHVWTDPVRQAVQESDFEGLVVLAAEVSWLGKQPQTRIIETGPLPPSTALAVRVQVPPDGFDPTEVLADLLLDLRQSHPNAGELQLDMDLPTRRLPEYGDWLQALTRFGPLSFTALPTWLDDPHLAEVVEAADGWVLQVHWLQPPSSPQDVQPLLASDAADSVERAAHLGRNFQVALPTYGYQLAFDADGKLRGVAAEQGDLQIPDGGTTVELMADPASVAALVAGWQSDRPPELDGLCWFRLPVQGDRRVWPAETLAAVRAGRTPVAVAEVELRREDQAWTVVLSNSGEAPLPLPPIELGAYLMADALGPYSLRSQRLIPHPGAPALPPNHDLAIGWVLATSPPNAHVVPTPDPPPELVSNTGLRSLLRPSEPRAGGAGDP